MDNLLNRIKSYVPGLNGTYIKPQTVANVVTGIHNPLNLARQGVARYIGSDTTRLLGKVVGKGNTSSQTDLAPSRILSGGQDIEQGTTQGTSQGTTRKKTVPIITSRVANNQSKQNAGFISSSIDTINNANQIDSQNQQQSQNQQGLETKGNVDSSGAIQQTYRSSYGEGLSQDDNSYLRSLDNMMLRSDAASRVLMTQIKQNYSSREQKISDINRKYVAGLESAGIRGGSAQSTPQLFDAQIRNAEIASQENLVKLDQEEMMALAQAQQNMDENNWKLVNEQVKYIKDVRKAKAEELQNQLKLQWEMNKFYETQDLKREIESAKLGLGYAKLNQSKELAYARMNNSSKKVTAGDKKSLFKKITSASTLSETGLLDSNGFITPEGLDEITVLGDEYGFTQEEIIKALTENSLVYRPRKISGRSSNNKKASSTYNLLDSQR